MVGRRTSRAQAAVGRRRGGRGGARRVAGLRRASVGTGRTRAGPPPPPAALRAAARRARRALAAARASDCTTHARCAAARGPISTRVPTMMWSRSDNRQIC